MMMMVMDILSQLIRDYEDVNAVNQQLEKM